MEEDPMSDQIEQQYKHNCQTPSDINEHLPTLYRLSMGCEHVTEFGVRYGASTSAFLYAATRKGGPTFVAYDIVEEANIPWMFDTARREGADATFIKGDTLKININSTDLLFIDTNHTYEHLTEELYRHASKVKRFMVFHDTISHGVGRPNTEQRGLLSAIIHYIISCREWAFYQHYTNNNGLTVLYRTS
jgi:hypothetical protein